MPRKWAIPRKGQGRAIMPEVVYANSIRSDELTTLSY